MTDETYFGLHYTNRTEFAVEYSHNPDNGLPWVPVNAPTSFDTALELYKSGLAGGHPGKYRIRGRHITVTDWVDINIEELLESDGDES